MANELPQSEPLQWREVEPAPGRKEHRATFIDARPDQFYVVQPEGDGWNVRRSYDMMFLGSLDRDVASVEEGKDLAEADFATLQRLARWVSYWTTHEPPAS